MTGYNKSFICLVSAMGGLMMRLGQQGLEAIG